MKTEGPDKDPTGVETLPSEAVRMPANHILDINKGVYKPEIRGALTQIGEGQYNLDKFMITTVSTRSSPDIFFEFHSVHTLGRRRLHPAVRTRMQTTGTKVLVVEVGGELTGLTRARELHQPRNKNGSKES